MAYGTPADPVAGTVITVAYAVANLLNPIRALRSFTGGTDPPGSNYLVMSDSTAATTWKTMTAAIGYTPVNRAGDSMTGSLILPNSSVSGLYINDAGGTPRRGASIDGSNNLFFGDPSLAALFMLCPGGILRVSDGVTPQVVWHTGNDAPLAKLSGATFTAGVSCRDNLTVFSIGASPGIVRVVSPSSTTNYGQFYDNGTDVVLASNLGNGFSFGRALGAHAQVGGYPIWDAGNDGAGSGLDADLLDGVDGSGYAPVGHTHATLVPSGLIAAFVSVGSIAPGWTRFTTANGKLLVGAGTFGGQTFVEGAGAGSSWTHLHGVSLTATATGAAAVPSGGASTASAAAHTHDVAGNTVDATWIPPSHTVVWAQKT